MSHSNKIKGLETLVNIGLQVPAFTVIPDFEVLGINNLPTQDSYNKNSVLFNVFQGALNILGESQNGYSLRSASFDEDTSTQSAAGRYLTFNGLNTLDDLYWSGINIWQHHRATTSKGIYCPLILQKTHCSYFSGVIFKNIKSDNDIIVMESYYGSCKSIVDGMILPYRSTFKDNTWQHDFNPARNECYRFLSHKSMFRQNESFEPGQQLTPIVDRFPGRTRVYADFGNNELNLYGYRPSLPPVWYENICTKLKDVSMMLDTGEGVDLEWGTSLTGDLYYYQYRRLTRPIFVDTDHSALVSYRLSDLTQNVYYGLPVSQGIVQGYITHNIDKADEKNILMLRFASTDNIKGIEQCAAVVSSYGGLLSHLAIVCRELKKPCVLGIKTVIPEGTYVELDGSSGIIKIIT